MPKHLGELRPFKYNRQTKHDFFRKLLPCRNPDQAIGANGQHMDLSQLHAIDFVVGDSVSNANAVALPLDAIFQEISTANTGKESTGTKRAKCFNARECNKKSRMKHLANQLYIMDAVPNSCHDELVVEDPPIEHSGAQSSNQAMVPSAPLVLTNLVVTSTTPKRDGDQSTILGEAPVYKKAKQLENRQFIPKLCPRLLAKFTRLPINGGSMKRDTGASEHFSSYPQANHDGPKFKRVATIATDLCASARDQVYLDSEGAVIGRPPEDFPS